MIVRGVLFDLDGTLVDSLEDLTDAVNHMLTGFGKPILAADAVCRLIGKGARNLVQQALSTEVPADIERGLALFLEFNTRHISDKSRLYPGAREMLEKLVAAGIRLAIVSNKNESLSRLILQALDAEQYFSVLCGGDSCSEMKPSPLPLLRVMEQLGTTADTTVMVGDSINDILAGRRAGMTTIGCNWGFGFPEELIDASRVAASCAELEQFLLPREA
jgi:phosphoglycolate phosphatase